MNLWKESKSCGSQLFSQVGRSSGPHFEPPPFSSAIKHFGRVFLTNPFEKMCREILHHFSNLGIKKTQKFEMFETWNHHLDLDSHELAQKREGSEAIRRKKLFILAVAPRFSAADPVRAAFSWTVFGTTHGIPWFSNVWKSRSRGVLRVFSMFKNGKKMACTRKTDDHWWS